MDKKLSTIVERLILPKFPFIYRWKVIHKGKINSDYGPRDHYVIKYMIKGDHKSFEFYSEVKKLKIETKSIFRMLDIENVGDSFNPYNKEDNKYVLTVSGLNINE
jgi:hypothetical protein